MLSPELLAQVKRLHVRTGRMVTSMMAGHYRSVFRGSGMEFEEVREYQPGDEVKSIDWKVTARSGKPYVKRYREERELVLMLLVDVSASGLFGAGDRSKREQAGELAALLASTAIRNNDKVGVILFSDRVERYIPPKKGAGHVWRVIQTILGHTPEGRGTDIAAAADYLGRVQRKHCVAFVISDFQAADYANSLKRAARKHDCVAAIVSDAGEFNLPETGLIEAIDHETGRRVLLDAGDATVRNWFAKERTLRYRQTLDALAQAGLDRIELNGRAAPVDALTRFFRMRERRFRA